MGVFHLEKMSRTSRSCASQQPSWGSQILHKEELIGLYNNVTHVSQKHTLYMYIRTFFKNSFFVPYVTITLITRKRFSEKPIVAFTKGRVFILDFHILVYDWPKGNRIGTVIVLVSSGMDFVNTPRLYSDQAIC